MIDCSSRQVARCENNSSLNETKIRGRGEKEKREKFSTEICQNAEKSFFFVTEKVRTSIRRAKMTAIVSASLSTVDLSRSAHHQQSILPLRREKSSLFSSENADRPGNFSAGKICLITKKFLFVLMKNEFRS